MSKYIISTQEAAKILEVNERTIRRYIHNNKLSAIKGNYGGYKITESSIRCFISNNDKYSSEDIHKKVKNLSNFLYYKK